MVLGVQRPSTLCVSGLLINSKGKGHEVKDNLNDQPLIARITFKTSKKRWLQQTRMIVSSKPYDSKNLNQGSKCMGRM
jgi:hypothetical protein